MIEKQSSKTFHHISVMRDEAVEALKMQADGIYVDATFGGGGYSAKMLVSANAKIIAFDRDINAIENGQALVREAKGRLTLVHAPFSALQNQLEAMGVSAIDGIVMDLGVSSPQIDQPERGFSFRFNGPLDMRMDTTQGRTAADIVNQDSEEDLATIFYTFGEERKSRAIARAIVSRRQEKLFTSTEDLAQIVRSVVRVSRKDLSDPATRTFQALRIAVNQELEELKEVLHQAVDVLRAGGRIVIVSFHSLEDRIVKTFFAQMSGKSASVSRYAPEIIASKAKLKIITSSPKTAGAEELFHNSRARSAKMRIAERLAA